MKLANKITLIWAFIAILAIGVAVLVVTARGPANAGTITSYQDTDGWIYDCSQPIKAKSVTIPHIGGESQGLIPISQADSDAYCHKIGIE